MLRWSGLGHKEFIANLTLAYKSNAPTRAIIVKTDNIEGIKKGANARQFNKKFYAKIEWIGKITVWENDIFALKLKKDMDIVKA